MKPNQEQQNTPRPAPYSNDLRQKAIAAVRRGERKIDVSKMFKISRNTLDLWLKREEETGTYQPIQGYQQGCSTKSRIGSDSVSLSNSMAAKPRPNWPSCGETM